MTQTLTPRSSRREVFTLDCDYLQPRFAAAYLVVDRGPGGVRAYFVETNTTHSVPILLDALRRAGVAPDQVEYVIVTHVHLDHAGGASALMKACPRATLLAHPRAAPHMIDPSKLVASARAVYGDERFEKLYGRIEPIEAARVRAVEDEARIPFAGSELRFFHTRGHANHHFCVQDPQIDAVFTGDAFGLAYPDLQNHGLFIFPSTSPTDFDPELARSAVKKIASCGTGRAMLTHFGEVRDLQSAARQLIENLDFSEKVLKEAEALLRGAARPDQSPSESAGSDLHQAEALALNRLREHFSDAFAAMGLAAEEARRFFELMELDLELNASGIAHVARKRVQKGSSA